MRIRTLGILFAVVVAVTALPRAGVAADDAHVTFAAPAHKAHAQAHVDKAALGRCGVCGSARFESNQLVEVLGGRYTFENVQQAYCPVCHVTTMTLDRTMKSTQFVRALWWKVPASRGQVARSRTSFALALASSDTVPFINSVTGLERTGGKVYLVVE